MFVCLQIYNIASTALILIDIQKDYFPGRRMELVGSTEAAGAAARLLAAFRKASWPVFHIQGGITEVDRLVWI